MNENKNILLYGIIVVLIVALCAVTCLFIVGGDKNKNLINNNDDANNLKVDNNKNTNVMTLAEYFDTVEITSATIKHYKSGMGLDEDINKTVNLTSEEFKKLIANFNTINLIKSNNAGFGGIVENDTLIINYKIKSKQYIFKISMNGIIFVNNDLDEDNVVKEQALINLLEKNVTDLQLEDQNEYEDKYLYYIIKNYSTDIYNEYFN